MKNKIIIIIIILLSFLIMPNVSAKNRTNDKNVANKCTYIYDSYGSGKSSAEIHVYNDGSVHSWITKMNGTSKEDDEKNVGGWSKQIYEKNGNKCPPYVVVETSWNNRVYAFWDKESAYNQYKGWYAQQNEVHILGSTTSEDDWGIKLTDTYALNDDFRDNETDSKIGHGDAVKQCTYSQTIDGEVTSGVLSFFNDGAVYAEITRMNGSKPLNSEFNLKKSKNYNNIKDRLANQECPRYMIADTDGINEVDFAYDKNDLSGWNLGHDTRLIGLTTKEEDYDPQEDGGVKSKDELIEDHKEEIAREDPKYKTYNPDDPYGDEAIGDNFCSTKEVVQALKALGIFVLIAKFAIPIIIIGMGTIEVAKVVVAGDEGTLKKQLESLGKRVIVGLFIFFIPNFMQAIFSGLHQYSIISDDANQCQACLLAPFGEGHCVEGGSSAGSTPTRTVDGDMNLDYDKSVDIEEVSNNKNAETEEISNKKNADAGNLDNNKDVNTENINNDKNVNTGNINNNKTVDANNPNGGNTVSTGSTGANNDVEVGATTRPTNVIVINE